MQHEGSIEDTIVTDEVLREAGKRSMTKEERLEQRVSLIMGAVGGDSSRKDEIRKRLQEKGY